MFNHVDVIFTYFYRETFSYRACEFEEKRRVLDILFDASPALIIYRCDIKESLLFIAFGLKIASLFCIFIFLCFFLVIFLITVA